VRYRWPGSPAAASSESMRAASGMTLAPFRTDDWGDAKYAEGH
jgi:hypothetical protein